jgi:hypothetical protein
VNTNIPDVRYRFEGSESTACAAARSVSPLVLARPVAWANSFGAGLKRISTLPMANT